MVYLMTSMYLGDQLSWLEHLPYKQGVIGSSPISPTIFVAEIAQLVEQLICNQQVPGSSPGFGTIFFGEVAKRLNATDCKSVLIEFDGSNPSLSTTYDIASQPSGKASDFDSDMRQFESNRGSHFFRYDLLAQLVEHLTFNQRVMSSNLIQVTMCLSGGIGRRTGLKILRESTLVPVQVRPQAPLKNFPISVSNRFTEEYPSLVEGTGLENREVV